MQGNDDKTIKSNYDVTMTMSMGNMLNGLSSIGQNLASVFASYGGEIAIGAMVTSTTGLVAIGSYVACDWIRANKDLPSRNDKRERMANQLLSRGHATMDELLEASYGEWPPKGLDILDKNTQRVEFVSLLGMRKLDTKNPLEAFRAACQELRDIAGRARLNGPREIGINALTGIFKPGFTGRSNVASVVGHEAVHILQGDHYWRADDIFDKDDAIEIQNRLQDAKSNMLARVVFRKENLLPGVDLKDKTRLPLSRNLAYHSQGIEIQARIHQLMADGYQHWGVMPATREEVQISMMNMGLIVPSALREKLQASPDFEKISEKFRYEPENPNRHVQAAMRSLNYVQTNSLNDVGRMAFCNFGIPMLYGDLIEMYGDRHGCERFSQMVNKNRMYRENRMLVSAVAMALENDHELAAFRKGAPAAPLRPYLS